MNIKKAIGTLILLSLAVGSIFAVKNSSGLKNWVAELTGAAVAISAGANLGTDAHNVTIELDGKDFGSEGAGNEDFPPFPSEVELPSRAAETPTPTQAPVVVPTTIEGGMVIRNETNFEIDVEGLLREGVSQVLPKEGVQVLIIHTHGSESYTPDADNNYNNNDNYHTDDKSLSVIRVGDELASCFEAYGLNVIHDREIYDSPSYGGSYPRSEAAVEKYLAEHPEIAVVIDLHRDSLGSGGVVYKTVAESDRQPSSQLMFVVGSDGAGLAHPNWKENMKFALHLQSAVVNKYPSLMRPILIRNSRYNQHLTTGSLIVEVGSTGNTLPEALQAIKLFADAVAPSLLELQKN